MWSRAASLVPSLLLEGPHGECCDGETSPGRPAFAGRRPSLGRVSAGTPPRVPQTAPDCQSRPGCGCCAAQTSSRTEAAVPAGPGKGRAGRAPGLRPRPLAFLRPALGFLTRWLVVNIVTLFGRLNGFTHGAGRRRGDPRRLRVRLARRVLCYLPTRPPALAALSATACLGVHVSIVLQSSPSFPCDYLTTRKTWKRGVLLDYVVSFFHFSLYC